MSCFSLQKTSPEPSPTVERNDLIAAVSLNPDRPVIAAAGALAAHMAGCDLVLLRSDGPIVSPSESVRELLDSAPVPLAVDLGCTGALSAMALKAAGARKVVVSSEAVINPGIVGETIDAVGPESCMFLVDCRSSGPDLVEVVDASGRDVGLECGSWLKGLESMGARNVILRPQLSTPSEALLSVVDATSISVHIERPGWSLALARALGAEGLVIEGALGCREQIEWEEAGLMELNSAGGSG